MSAADRRDALAPRAMAALAFAFFLLPGLLGPYGYFIDELYYLSCADRPAWGYVDHPPGAPLLLRALRPLLGDGLFALRLPAALAGGALVLGVGLLARRLGAGRTGQAAACLGVMIAPIYQIFFGFYSMNAFETLAWFGIGWILIETAHREDRRLWIALGLVAGAGLLFKHTVVVYAAGIALGLLVTPARRLLARPGIWIAALLAAAMLAPNLVWQERNGWPSLEFYRFADLYKNVPTPPHVGLVLQILVLNPATLPLWAGGILWFLRRRAPADLRHLGWSAVFLLGLMLLSMKSRPDRIAGMYPLLLAAGAVWIEEWAAGRGRWTRVAIPAWLVGWGIVLAPLAVPIVPPDVLARTLGGSGLVPQIEAGAGKRPVLPQWLADRLGWEELVEDVARVRDALPPEERARVRYFAPSYGQAGALEQLGRERGLVPVTCTHNSWFLWGPPEDSVEVAIVLGNDPESLAELFEEVELAALHDCRLCTPWRNHMPIWICRRSKVRIADRWPQWKDFGQAWSGSPSPPARLA